MTDIVLGIILSSYTTAFSQDTTSTGYSLGRLDLPTPSIIEDLYTYDPITDRYIYSKIVGDFSISYPLTKHLIRNSSTFSILFADWLLACWLD